MMRRAMLALWLIISGGLVANADEIMLLRKEPDPFGYPRPFHAQQQVPLGTSFFLMLGFQDPQTKDSILIDSIEVSLQAAGADPVPLVSAGQKFAAGCSGSLAPSRNPASSLAIYIDGGQRLQPETGYTLSVSARSAQGGRLSTEQGRFQFSTASGEVPEDVEFALDVSTSPIQWRGGFFTGFCKPSFCTSVTNRLPGYGLMSELRKEFPRSWSLQRDFTLTGTLHQPQFLDPKLPNLVCELETRRIVSMQAKGDLMELTLEDVFGHEQYGIPSDRPLADDYQIGEEVLIADGQHHVLAKIENISADAAGSRRLEVTKFEHPPGGWQFDDHRPKAPRGGAEPPGNFPQAGCYLRKFRPGGTPCYYWDRLDQEWDIAHRQHGRRLVVNFTDAPGDLAVDGRQWTYPKDYVQYHRVVRDITSHTIERYGDASLDFVWSVFNEPDLAAVFWRSGDWIEAQKFYDYTVDAVLRSFEDHGYDSQQVFIGGVEIGAIFGVHIEEPILKKLLCHCSPLAECEGALELNQAFADPRLDGQRSRRVEQLCRAHDGKGSPCDFISIHGYNTAERLAAKLKRGKELALEIDADYFEHLWVNSFETCPDWAPPPDTAALDSYLGNGYFTTWCAEVVQRQLTAANVDSRFSFGESLLTFWPWPNQNFRGHNNATQVISVDDDDDGQPDREVTIALPILNFLGLLSDMGPKFWVLPSQQRGPHRVSGFVSEDQGAWKVLLYSHDRQDVQSRQETEFEVTLSLDGVPAGRFQSTEFRFDKDHNSFFRLGRRLRESPRDRTGKAPATPEQVEEILAAFDSNDATRILTMLKTLEGYAELPQAILARALRLHQETDNSQIREAIETVGQKLFQRDTCFASKTVAQLQQLSVLQPTAESQVTASEDQPLQLTVRVSANGANVIRLRPLSP